MPYYLISNKYGLYGDMQNGGYLRCLFTSGIDTSKNYNPIYGLDIIDRYDGKNRFNFMQFYAGIEYKQFVFWAGARNEFYGNQDTLLSSGGAIWSGNAPAIPKIILSTRDFISLPFAQKWLKVNLGIAHGWFGNDGYVKNAFLHQKYLYVRFGKSENFFFTAGIQHYTQWGGKSPKYGQLPDNFKNYLKVFFAYNNEDKYDSSQTGLPPNEAGNRIGNHLGTKDFGLDFILYKKYKIKLYWQNFIEDITGVGFRNAMDGIWGISIKKSNWAFNYEYIHTYTNYVPADQLRTSLDNYFNNSVYRSGWTYKGYVIGTPLITSPVLLADSLFGGNGLPNNRVIAHHLAFQFVINNIIVNGNYIHSKNYGNSVITYYSDPLLQNSYGLSVTCNKILKNIALKLSFALDNGDLLGKNWGIGASIVYKIQ
jgi:hypothetical protein